MKAIAVKLRTAVDETRDFVGASVSDLLLQELWRELWRELCGNADLRIHTSLADDFTAYDYQL